MKERERERERERGREGQGEETEGSCKMKDESIIAAHEQLL